MAETVAVQVVDRVFAWVVGIGFLLLLLDVFDRR